MVAGRRIGLAGRAVGVAVLAASLVGMIPAAAGAATTAAPLTASDCLNARDGYVRLATSGSGKVRFEVHQIGLEACAVRIVGGQAVLLGLLPNPVTGGGTNVGNVVVKSNFSGSHAIALDNTHTVSILSASSVRHVKLLDWTPNFFPTDVSIVGYDATIKMTATNQTWVNRHYNVLTNTLR